MSPSSHKTGIAKHSLPRNVISAIFALLIAAALQFGAIVKFAFPNPEKTLDALGLPHWQEYVAVGIFEVVVLMLILTLHRWKVTWAATAWLFAGFLGYVSFYTFIRGESCGCFGKFTPPAGFTVVMDISFVIGALCLAWAWGMRKKALIFTAFVVPVMFVGGFALGDRLAPPTKEEIADIAGGKSNIELLTATPEFAPLLATTDEDPFYYVFIYDQYCVVCNEYKTNGVDNAQLTLEQIQDPTLQVMQFEKYALEAAHNIDPAGWQGSPTVLLVYAGEIRKVWHGDAAPYPQGSPDGSPDVYTLAFEQFYDAYFNDELPAIDVSINANTPAP